MFVFSIIFYLISTVAVAGLICVVSSGIVALCRKVFTKNDLKLAIAAIAIVLILICVALSPAASRAEELQKDQYYKVVFVDEVEELEDELLLHGDDANHIWDWYEDYPSKDEEFVSFEFDEELSNLALCWAQRNGFFVQINKENRIIEDRIVVLTMRHSDDPNGDETMGSYFTEFVTR